MNWATKYFLASYGQPQTRHWWVCHLYVCLVAQLCPTHCDPMDNILSGSSAMEFSRQEYQCRLSFPSPGDLPKPGIKCASSMSPAQHSGQILLALPHLAQGYAIQHMLMQYNEHILRHKVQWKSNFLPSWNQLILTSFCHVLWLGGASGKESAFNVGDLSSILSKVL